MVEIADDEAERQRGLMERPPLADDRGMLFQFPDVRERGFWMRNTPSPLDIIYIDPRGRIVSIAKNAAPNIVLATWQMPPPTTSTICPPEMPPPQR